MMDDNFEDLEDQDEDLPFTDAQRPVCGKCGELKKKAIYGMPAGPMDEDRYAIMGCLIDMDRPMPQWVCTNCED